MAMIHFLNVKIGGCSLIEHASGHITVFNVYLVKTPEPKVETKFAPLAIMEPGITKEFTP